MAFLQIGASTHHVFYSPGDVVRCTVSLENRNISDRGGLGHADPFREVAATGISGDALCVESLCVTATGECVMKLKSASSDVLECDTRRGGTDDLLTLFQTEPFQLLTERVTLFPSESRLVSFTFALPVQLPPSYRGRFCNFFYNFSFVAECSGVRAASALTLPIRIVGCTTVTTRLCVTRTFPVAVPASAFTSSGALPHTPQWAIAPPAESSVYTSANGARDHSRPCSSAADNGAGLCGTAFLASALGACRDDATHRASFTVPIAGIPTLLVTADRAVILGGRGFGAVCGEVRCIARSSHTRDLPVAVKGELSLETIECCDRRNLPAALAATLPTLREYADVCVTRTTTVAVEELPFLSISEIPFVIPIDARRYAETMLTDIVSTLWQLRLRVYWTRLSVVEAASAMLKVESTPVEVIFPITVFPPVDGTDSRKCGAIQFFSAVPTTAE